jgi:DNA-binding response OmpR family regulator
MMGLHKLLIVDDETSILTLLEQVFSNTGIEIVTAQSAEEALEILERDTFHVMLLDLNLPGMSGIELCRIIRQRQPMAIVFAMTGYSSLFELSDCREAGFEDYFKKPVKLSSLLKNTKAAFEKINRWKQ